MLGRMKKFFTLSYLSLVYTLPSVVFARQYTDPTREEPPELSGAMIEKFLNDVVYKYIFPVAGLICFIFIIKGGYIWMISSGDPEKVKQAMGTLTWSVVGLVFVILARLLIDVIMDFIA